MCKTAESTRAARTAAIVLVFTCCAIIRCSAAIGEIARCNPGETGCSIDARGAPVSSTVQQPTHGGGDSGGEVPLGVYINGRPAGASLAAQLMEQDPVTIVVVARSGDIVRIDSRLRVCIVEGHAALLAARLRLSASCLQVTNKAAPQRRSGDSNGNSDSSISVVPLATFQAWTTAGVFGSSNLTFSVTLENEQGVQLGSSDPAAPLRIEVFQRHLPVERLSTVDQLAGVESVEVKPGRSRVFGPLTACHAVVTMNVHQGDADLYVIESPQPPVDAPNAATSYVFSSFHQTRSTPRIYVRSSEKVGEHGHACNRQWLVIFGAHTVHSSQVSVSVTHDENVPSLNGQGKVSANSAWTITKNVFEILFAILEALA